MTALSAETFNTFYNTGKTFLQMFTEETVTKKMWKAITNSMLDEFHDRIADEDAKDHYKETYVIDKKVVTGGDSDDSTFHVGNQIVDLIGASNLGAVWTGQTGIDENWLGAVFQFVDASAASAVLTGTIIEIINEYSFKVLSDSGTPFPAFVQGSDILRVLDNYDLDIIELGEKPLYPTIDKITLINDAAKGTCEMISEAKFHGIFKPGDKNTMYSEDILCYRRGSKVVFGKGDDVTADDDFVYARTMHYKRYPNHIVANTDMIDVKRGYVQTVKEMVLIKILQMKNQPIPQDLMSTANKMQQIKEANRNELKTTKGE